MSASSLLPLTVAIPIVGAVASPILARGHRRLPLCTGIVALLGTTALLVVLAVRVFHDHAMLTDFVSGERPVHGHALGIALVADPLGMMFALVTATLGALLLLSVLSELGHLGPKELGWLGCLMQLLVAALIGSAFAADAVDLFVWFELAALASYGLTGFFLERPIALEAAFKNLVLTSTAGFAVFTGAGMLYSRTGALDLGQLHVAMTQDRADRVAIALLVAGFATKAGLMPFHGWLPDAHTPVPGAVSALFSGLMVNLGVVGLVRTVLLTFPGRPAATTLLTVLGIASAVLGAVLALVQDDLKRLLAWDTVSQMGLLVTGFASRTEQGEAGATYHLVNHAVFKALLFLCAGAVVHATGKTKLSELGGLARRRPGVTAAFTVGCLAIAGVPPLNGFASVGLIHEGLMGEPVVYGLALLAQLVTVAALARAAYLGFYRRRDEAYEHLESPRAGMRVALGGLAACCVAFGVLAEPIVSAVVAPVAAVLHDPSLYAHAALGGHVQVPTGTVRYDYANVADLLLAIGEIMAGLLVAWFVVQKGPPRATTWLRRVHTGSVNDYALMQAGGIVIAAFALLA